MTSKTSAMQQARKEIYLVDFSGQYKIHSWANKSGSTIFESEPMDYWQARAAVSVERTWRTLTLLGMSSDCARYWAHRHDYGSLNERVTRALAG